MTSLKEEAVHIYNTLSRRKEKFKPVIQGEVRMYTCGPTVYNYIHIGNARPLIIFDVVRRYFEYLGYAVTYVQNITDVDDKIIAQAIEEDTTTQAIAERFIKYFSEDCQKLGVRSPDKNPKASEYIEEMIHLIRTLVDTGFAYEVEGNVFFEAGKDPQYGILSGKDLEKMETGERVDDDIQRLKKDPKDFSLWKPAKAGEPFWESPWGNGRPGWHTECTVMSTKLLGKEFDIHAGGIDLIFPHHENEIAQARCSENAPFARYWMHNEFVNLKDQKMAKSEGNVVLVRDLVKNYRKEAIRLFFLQTHYRKPINFDEEYVRSAQSALEKIDRVVQNVNDYIENYIKKSGSVISKKELQDNYPEDLNHFRKLAEEGMNEDFNTAIVLSEMFALVDWLDQHCYRPYNKTDCIKLMNGLALLEKLDSFTGIVPKQKKELSEERDKIEGLIEKRDEYRRKKEWENADRIRDELLEMGIVLEDKKDGTRWWRRRQENK